VRVKSAQEFLDDSGVEWLSFQFVCYGFHPKGFVRSLPQISSPLLQGRKVHVMLHELWIGAAKNSTFKDRLTGWLQKYYILRWLRALQPRLVHTSNSAYRQLLARENMVAHELPLFGNIPVDPGNGQWINAELSRLGVSAGTRGEFWILGLFGGIPTEWQCAALLERLLPMAEKQKKKVIFASIGRHGPGDIVLTAAEEPFRGRMQFLRLGPQTESRVSEFLAAVDFGVATVPWSLFGKSGAAAAMLDHGLPVIVNRNDVQFDVPAPPAVNPRVILLDENFERRLLAAERQVPSSSRAKVAAALCDALEQAAQ